MKFFAFTPLRGGRGFGTMLAFPRDGADCELEPQSGMCEQKPFGLVRVRETASSKPGKPNLHNGVRTHEGNDDDGGRDRDGERARGAPR